MKTSYYLVTAAVLAAAAVAVRGQLPIEVKPVVVPLAPPQVSSGGALPGAPAMMDPLALPPIVVDPSETVPVAAPVVPPTLPVAPPPRSAAGTVVPSPSVPAPPALPPAPPHMPKPSAGANVPVPSVPAIPLVPAPLPNSVSAQPSTPAAPPALPKVPPPAAPMTPPPAAPVVPPAAPMPPALPKAPPPAAPTVQPPGAQLPAPTLVPPSGQVILLHDGKLAEGTVTVAGDQVVVRHGAINRTFKKDEVQFVGNSKDDVYRHLLGKVKADDAPGRLRLARWCMFNGLRPQALAEAREVVKLQPGNTAATDMVRSLEESLRLFPGDGTVPAAPLGDPAVRNPSVTTDPEPDVSPEAATLFAARVQPVFANLCADCHAKAEYKGSFQLARTTGYDTSPATTRQNLRAAMAQLKKDDPVNSPLLVKAVTRHGAMREPVIAGRHVSAYKVLEGWVTVAVGCPPAAAVPPMVPPTPLPSDMKPVLPPAPAPDTRPALPAAPPPMNSRAVPPGSPAPVLPPAPPPVIPPAADPKPGVPGLPTIPPIPRSGESSDFGREAKPLPLPAAPSPTNSGAAVDEFDPSVFNRTTSPILK